MAESISMSNPPHIEYVQNNTGSNYLRCLNYRFYLKTMGKKAACFRCSENKWDLSYDMGHGDGTFHTKSKYFAQLYTTLQDSWLFSAS